MTEFPIKSYVINLDKDSKRLEYVLEHCSKFGLRPTRVSGILGSSLNQKEIKEKTTTLCSMFCTNSTIGSSLSHLKCYETILNNDDEEALILEDDVEFSENFLELFDNAYKNLPKDYDICFVGSCGLIETGNYISENLFIPDNIYCCQCYLVSRKGSKKLLDLLKKVNGYIDVEINTNRRNLNLYAVYPTNITKQREEFTIDSNNSPFNFPQKTNNFIKDFNIEINNKPLASYLNLNVFQLGSYKINVWILIFLLVGLLFSFLYYLKLFKILYIFLFLYFLFFIIEFRKEDIDNIGLSIIFTIIGFLLFFIFLILYSRFYKLYFYNKIF